MQNPLLRCFASFVVLSAITVVASAAEPQGNAHPCSRLVDPTERLACYDSAFPPVSGARSGGVDLQAEKAKALEEYGLNQGQLTEREPERAEVQVHRIEATVAQVNERSSGERVVTLDNQQTWLLTETSGKGRLRPGDRVVIRNAALGTFMLITPSRVPLRARRIN